MPALTPSNVLAYIVQVTVIVACGAGLARLATLPASALKLAWLRLVLVGCLALPFVQPLRPREPGRSGESGAPGLPSASAQASSSVESSAPGAPAAPDVAASAARLASSWTRQPAAWLSLTLVAGSAARLLWLVSGMAALGRLRRRASRLAPRPPAIDRAVALAAADADFRVSSDIGRPVCFGARRAVVLLPAAFAEFPAIEQHAVACHELVHVRRLDWLRSVGDELIRVLLWFQPAIWWLLDEIHLAREQVVDREVVELVGNRRPYLDALLKLARQPMRPALRPVSAVVGGTHLRERVALLVKEVPMSKSRLFGGIAVSGAAAFLAGALVVHAAPLHRGEPAAIEEGAAPLGFAVATAAAPEALPQSQPPKQSARPGEAGPGQQAPRPGMTTAKPRPKILSKVEPVYPDDAKAAGVQGFVLVEARINTAGLVTGAKIVRSVPLLDQAAIDAVRQWRFEPVPVETLFTVTIRFALDGSRGPATGAGVEGGVAGGVAGGVGDGVRGGVAGASRPVAGLAVVSRVEPDLSAGAVPEGADRLLLVEGTVTAAGTVAGARAVAGVVELAERAAAAVARWTFERSDADQPLKVGFNAAAIRPGQMPGARLHVGGAIKPPAKIKDVKPVYPADAQQARTQGIVILETTISPDGRVRDVRILRSVPGLDEAAMTAVLQWEFTPTLVNGEPAAVAMTVTVNFTLR